MPVAGRSQLSTCLPWSKLKVGSVSLGKLIAALAAALVVMAVGGCGDAPSSSPNGPHVGADAHRLFASHVELLKTRRDLDATLLQEVEADCLVLDELLPKIEGKLERARSYSASELPVASRSVDADLSGLLTEEGRVLFRIMLGPVPENGGREAAGATRSGVNWEGVFWPPIADYAKFSVAVRTRGGDCCVGRRRESVDIDSMLAKSLSCLPPPAVMSSAFIRDRVQEHVGNVEIRWWDVAEYKKEYVDRPSNRVVWLRKIETADEMWRDCVAAVEAQEDAKDGEESTIRGSRIEVEADGGGEGDIVVAPIWCDPVSDVVHICLAPMKELSLVSGLDCVGNESTASFLLLLEAAKLADYRRSPEMLRAVRSKDTDRRDAAVALLAGNAYSVVDGIAARKGVRDDWERFQRKMQRAELEAPAQVRLWMHDAWDVRGGPLMAMCSDLCALGRRALAARAARYGPTSVDAWIRNPPRSIKELQAEGR